MSYDMYLRSPGQTTRETDDLVLRVSNLLGSREPLAEVREIVALHQRAGVKLSLAHDQWLLVEFKRRMIQSEAQP